MPASDHHGLVVNVARDHGQRLLLLLHGYGADEHDLAPLADMIDPDGHFLTLCPRGPFDVESGTGAAWYHRDANGDIDQASFCGALVLLDQLVDATTAQTGLDPATMVVIGFSQGAAMTFALGLRDSTRPRPAAIAGLSGSIPEPPWLEYAWTAPDLPPTYVQHGLDDHVVPIDRARHTRQVLERHHLELEYHEYTMQHEINAPSLTHVRLWLEQH